MMGSRKSSDLSHDPADSFDFVSYFNHLLKTKRCIDVTFILDTHDGEVEILAHQMVLAIRSAYFADTFYGDQKEKENKIIRLEKINPKAFQDMIRYCYDYKPGLATLEEVCTLFRVAYQFKVISLMNLCHTHLIDTEIMPGNVFNMLEVSEYIEDQKLRDKCHKFLQEKTIDVMESYEMAQLTPAMIHIILDLSKLSLNSEYELIKWLIDWANAKIEEGNTICRNAKEYLKNMLQDMNFLALTFQEFAMICKDNPEFFNSEEITCIYLNIAYPGAKDMPDWYGKEMKIREYVGLREKLIHKDTDELQKCVTDILALEEILKSFMETIKCCSETNKKLKENSCDYSDCAYESYLLLKVFELFYRICNKLSKMVGKGEELEILGIDEKDFQVVKQLDTIFEIMENGGMRHLWENQTEVNRRIDNDESLEIMKNFSANEEEVRLSKNYFENDESCKRIKEMLQNYEENKINKILENLDEMYELHEICESHNEFSKDMCSTVIERIRRLREDYFKLLTELNRLIEERHEFSS